MKLVSLYINGYKNLENIKIDFSHSKGKTLIIGNNGVGKSNVLEVISAIFCALFNKNKNVDPDFKFELIYEMGIGVSSPQQDTHAIIKVSNNDGVIKLRANEKVIKPTDWRNYLPERVVAVYSGEEKRLWEQYYFKNYDNFNKQYIKSNKPYEFLKMVYINKYYWDLILSLLAISDIENYKRFIVENLHINNIEGIICKFDTKKAEKNKNMVAEQILNHINPDNKEDVFISLDNLKSLFDIVGYEEELFFNLAVLLLYKDYKIITSYNVVFNDGILTKALSEGEKKLLLIYGALNIFSGECLFLFDEPDAHLHEKGKSEVYDLISKRENSQIVVTSHSPKMIRLFPYDNQIVLRKIADGKLEAITVHEFDEFKEILDTDITFEEEDAIRESRMPLLLVEGKTDKNHLTTAWQKLYPEEKMPFAIVSLSCAEKIKQYISSVPDKFAKSIIIGLVDNDGEGQKVIKGCEKIQENIYKFKNDQNQNRRAYCIMLPLVDDNVNVFNYCPIEFMYDWDTLVENDVIKKRCYSEAMSLWAQKGRECLDNAQYNTTKELCFYKVEDSIKNRFSEKVAEFSRDKFIKFETVFNLIKEVLTF